MINSVNIKKMLIDIFLKDIQRLSQKHPIDGQQIYYQLTNYGIGKEEQMQDLSHIFDKLQQTNQHPDKMDVFVDPKWSCFCQFVSKNIRQKVHMNPIKIYIPLRNKNIEASIQKIFSFISQNNIEHCSKLASSVRVDDLVIRVYNQEDANKIINFVNNDIELFNSMYNPNPFCVNENKVGLAMDRIVSYNSILADYINQYITMVNEKNYVANAGGFKMFLQKKLFELKAKENLDEILERIEDRYDGRETQYLKSLEEVTELLIKSIDGGKKEIIFKHFETTNNEDYNKQKNTEYSNAINPVMTEENNNLFRKIVRGMSMKYGMGSTIASLERYKTTADTGCITRSFGLREQVENAKNFRQYLVCINIEEEISKMFPKKVEITQPSKETILENACKETYIACQTPERGFCGKNQVAYSLLRIQQNDYKGITRNNNARELVNKNIAPNEVVSLIKKTLEDNGYLIENEADLYEFYATHIEYLCNNAEVRRGRV